MQLSRLAGEGPKFMLGSTYRITTTGDSSLQELPVIKNKISEIIFKKCSVFKSHLKEALEKLE
jgi:hypothetical protein